MTWLGDSLLALAALASGIWALRRFRALSVRVQQAQLHFDRLECYTEELIQQRRQGAVDLKRRKEDQCRP